MPDPLAPHPFRPLTDAEYALLARHLPATEGRPGRPPQDRRRTLNAIFWIACSFGPWKNLPPEYGRPDTASRTLRRWARSGHMNLLLHQVANRSGRDQVMRNLAWRICRAWRRVSRVVTLSQLMLAKACALQPALPADPRWLPDPDLSKAIQPKIIAALERVHEQAVGVFGAFARVIGQAGGNRRYWRLR